MTIVVDFITNDNGAVIEVVMKYITKEEQKTPKDHTMLLDNDLMVCAFWHKNKFKSLFD